MKRTILLLNILFLLILNGCSQQKNGNTQTGNPLVSVAMTGSGSNATAYYKTIPIKIWDLFIPRAIAYPAPSVMVDAHGNTIQLSQNWINIGEIEFKSSETTESGEVDGSDVDFLGPYSVDLFSSSPQLLGFNNVALSQIRRIKMKLSKTSTLPTGAPSSFLGKSMFLSGTVNGISFSFSTTDETEMQVAGPTAVTPAENKSLLLELKTANLIKKINLSAITSTAAISDSNRITATNPCPSIEPSANDLYTCFKKGYETESNLGRDDDGNFRLDSGEESVK